MKKILLALVLLCSVGFSKANPIPPPALISELYLVDSSHWYLEVVFKHYGGWADHSTLNGCRITTSSGTFYLKDGISTDYDSIVVITQDSLKSLLKINRGGDYITILDSAGHMLDQIYFGNIPGSQISFPRPGQSIVNYARGCWSGSGMHTEYHKVKDNHPTIGYNAFTAYNLSGITTTGTFKGIVYDKAHSLVSGIHVGNAYYTIPCGISACNNFFCTIVTDSAGTFNIPEYSGNYFVEVFFNHQNILTDSLLDIEPDSINYYEFTVDTLLTGLGPEPESKHVRLNCFPNPSTGETTISFEAPASKHSQTLIKIYSANGEAVRILPVTPGTQSVKWDGLHHDGVAASGIYTCVLEINGHKTATEKIIITQ